MTYKAPSKQFPYQWASLIKALYHADQQFVGLNGVPITASQRVLVSERYYGLEE